MIDITKPVKYITPNNPTEASLTFNVISYNEVTERAIIEPVNFGDFAIKPTFLVSIKDLENIKG